jgi:hypothetical protein
METPSIHPVAVLAFLASFAVISPGAARAGISPAVASATDREAQVSRADIVLDRPVARKEGGMPVGNGTMGSLVWTTPGAIKFQIMAIEISDSRAHPQAIATVLRMIRPPRVRTRNLLARSRFARDGDQAVLTQEFREAPRKHRGRNARSLPSAYHPK